MKTRGYRLYNIWLNMKQRCLNSNYPRYKDYGGRGIKLDFMWSIHFNLFEKWALENGYADNLTIDRKNVDGDYNSENCRWITNKEQQSNRRNNKKITFNGVTKTISSWADDLNVDSNCLKKRIEKGWDIEKSLTTKKQRKIIDLTGQKFGKITVISFQGSNHGANWNCICSCGKSKVIRGSNLISGVTKSCGCITKKESLCF